ncbi:MAG: retention module-containing protein [Gallionella sp.]
MPVATATNVKGKVTATNAKCEVRIINEGDPIEEGEVIKTGEGGSIDLALIGGDVVPVEAKQTVALDSEFLPAIAPEARDNALAVGGDDLGSIMTAIREGSSLDNLLDETAAGLSGGNDAGAANSGGGAGFVMLAGIVEAISPTPASAPDNNLNRGPVTSGNAYAAVQALASLQAAAHIAAIQAAAAQQVVAANTADTDAPVITLDPSTGVNAPITGTVTDAGGVVGTVQITATDIATGIATTTTVPVQANGAFSAPAPTDTGTYTVTVTAIDTAGNVSTVGGTADNTVVVDTTAIASITVDTVAGDDIVNAAEMGGTVAITGSVGGDAKPGDIVTLTVGGNAYTGFVASDSTYSISISGSILTANANIGASVTAVDASGNIATATAAHGYSVDTTATASITVNAITADNVINITEKGGTVAITGNVGGDAKPGDIVTLTVGDNTYIGMVAVNGAYSINVPGAALAANTSIGVSVTATDASGNTVTATAAHGYSIDTIAAASITVDAVAGNDVVNAAEAGNTVAITGSVGGDAKPGDTVTLTVGSNTYTGTVAVNGTYSIDVPGAALAANTNIGVSVTATDASGNTVTATAAHGYSVDTTAVASITVDAVAGNDVVNAAEAGDTVAVTGSVGGDAKPGDTVTLTVGNNTYTGTVAVNGTYSIDVPGAALAANTSIGVSVTATDANGNTATATATHGYAVDINPPTVTISTDDGVLTAGEMAHLTFTLSEASDSFTATAIMVSGGTLANFAGSGTRYTADFIPTPNSTAPATVTVASGSFADAMGNFNEFESTLNMSVNTMVGETLRGGHGRDTLVGGAGDDTLYGEEGKDKLYGGAGDDTLYGNEGKDKLYGGAGDDTLHGNEGKDKLYGGAGNDTLYGDEGKDTLKGGLGDDLLYGGEGKDIFAWSPEDIGTPGDPAVDTIADFNHRNDRIDLSSLLDGAEVGKRDIGNLLSYINVSKEGGDTVLHISSQGNFENGEYHPGKEDQRIVIENVDLTVQAGADVDQTKTLLNMLKNDNLNVNSD